MNTPSASALRSLLLSAALCQRRARQWLQHAPAGSGAARDGGVCCSRRFPARVRFLGIDPESLDRRSGGVVAALRNAADGGPVNVLALSGGGAGGAFGAGALVGMSRRGDRPVFHVVTGVSVGALLAPFAFLGEDWDAELLAAFADGRLPKLLRVGGPAVLFRSSIYPGAPLRAYIDRFVTQRLVDAVADEAARGRLLLVATTDLDKQETVIWDLGAIAAERGEMARVLFRDVLLASASIPGVFPPVLIRVSDGERKYDEMHVDGGTTVPFLVAPEILQIDAGRGLDLQGGRIHVLVNGSLAARPITTPARAVPVMSTRLFRELHARVAQNRGPGRRVRAAQSDGSEILLPACDISVSWPTRIQGRRAASTVRFRRTLCRGRRAVDPARGRGRRRAEEPDRARLDADVSCPG